MNKIKLNYETPVVRTFVVRFEGCLCLSPGVGTSGAAGGIDEGEVYVLGE